MVNKSCNSWSSPYQLSYAIGVGNLVATSLNTFSTFMVHDKINYNIDEPSGRCVLTAPGTASKTSITSTCILTRSKSPC
ncbi:hypothetical protein ACND5G_001174 [Escherichia coli]